MSPQGACLEGFSGLTERVCIQSRTPGFLSSVLRAGRGRTERRKGRRLRLLLQRAFAGASPAPVGASASPPPGRSAGPRPLPGAACSASRGPPLPEPSSSPLRRPQQACRTAPPRPRALTILQMEAMFLTVISLKVAAIPHRHLYEVKTAPLMVGRGQEGRGGGGGSGSGLG